MPAKDGYRRVVVWQPSTGGVVDMAGHDILFTATPGKDEESFAAADGTTLVRRRTRRLELPLIRSDKLAHVRTLEGLGCPAKAVAIGLRRHEVWLEPSQLHTIDQRRGFGSFAGAAVILENRVLEAAIYQATNLLEGIPWIGTESDGSDLVHTGITSGYDGPRWMAGAGTTVNGQGALLGGEATLEIEMPIGGAKLRLTDPENPLDFGGSVQCVTIGGTLLGTFSAGASFVVPTTTFVLHITITLANARPQLLVELAGRSLSAADAALLFPVTYTPCVSGGVTGGPTVGGGGAGGASGISLTCNECFVLFEDVALGAELDDATDETATPAPDGYHTFTRAVRQLQGYEFEVSVAFLSGASPATPAGAFLYAACGLACTLVDGDSVAEREIDFSIATDEITPGTYTVVLTVSYEDCVGTTQDLTFDLIIS